MLTKTQEQILAFLLRNPNEQVTIRGIAKRLEKSYTLIYNNIANLEKKDIIIKQSIPPGQVIKLNEFAPIEIFIDIELKIKNEFLKKYSWIHLMVEDILSSTKNLFFTLIVFGSYAKGTQTKNSDLDLLIMVQNKRDIKDIENAINRTYTKIKKSLNFIDAGDFKEMIKNRTELNIGNESRNHHIILYGVEIYCQMLKKG